MRKLSCFLILILVCTTTFCSAQQSSLLTAPSSDSTLTALQSLPSKYYTNMDKKINYINDRLAKKTLKYLRKFQKQVEKLQRKILQLNPNTAIAKADATYNNFGQKIKSKPEFLVKPSPVYIIATNIFKSLTVTNKRNKNNDFI